MAIDQTINTIAKALGEAGEGPLAQLQAVITHLGDEACLSLLAETEKIEQAGGLMRGDGSGRRSLGGVFFFLARQRLPREVRAAIFNDKAPREAKAPGSSPPPVAASPKSPALPPPNLGRRRVFEVVPAAKPTFPSRSEPRAPWPPPAPAGAFIPPELPTAVVLAQAKRGANAALLDLNPTDQYAILLEMLGDLHAQYGGEPLRSSEPRSERKPTSPPAALESSPAEEPVPKSKAKRATKASAAKARSHG